MDQHVRRFHADADDAREQSDQSYGRKLVTA